MTVIWHAEYDDKEIKLSQNGRYLEFNKRNSPAGTVFILLWGSAAFPFCDVVRI